MDEDAQKAEDSSFFESKLTADQEKALREYVENFLNTDHSKENPLKVIEETNKVFDLVKESHLDDLLESTETRIADLQKKLNEDIEEAHKMKIDLQASSVSEVNEVCAGLVLGWKVFADTKDGELFFNSMMPSIYGEDFLKNNKEMLAARAKAIKNNPNNYLEGQKILYESPVLSYLEATVMDKSCNDCGIKDTCLKRTLGIFLLYIRTGRISELTPEVKESFSIAEQCENWLPTQASQKEAAL
jgi:hypothetical protein